MNKFAQYLNDLRWAANMRRVRRFQRTLLFSEREVFFAELRPFADGSGKIRIAYPEAMIFIKIEDFLRAVDKVIDYRIARQNRYG